MPLSHWTQRDLAELTALATDLIHENYCSSWGGGMIKLRFQDNKGQSHIILGLSEGNFGQLKQGKPIIFRMAELGYPDLGDLCIMYGATEDAIVQELKGYGMPLA